MNSISNAAPAAPAAVATNSSAAQDDLIEPAPQSPSHSVLEPLPRAPKAKTLFQRARTALNKLREPTVFSAPLGLYTHMRDHPATPDVRGGPPPPPRDKPAKPLPDKRLDRLDGKLTQEAASVADRKHASLPAGAAATMANARASDAACIAAMDTLFATGDSGVSMGRRLLDDFTQVIPERDRAREAALLVAMGLAEGTGGDRDRARAAWRAIAADDNLQDAAVPQRRDVNDTLRALAAADLAYDALWALKSHRHHAVAEAGCWEEWKFALQATDTLLRQGVDLGADSAHGIADFAAHARTRPDGAPLGSTETADVLACRTLLCAKKDLDGKGAKATRRELAAYMAWRNGFRETGPGTDFNHAIHRLHKFTTWVLRARTGPTTTWGHVAQWMRGVAHAATATRLSPLDAARMGTIGAELGELPTVKADFERELGAALGILKEALQTQAQQLGEGEGNADRRAECLARAAVIDHWARTEGPRKNLALGRKEREHIRARIAESGSALPEPALARACRGKLTLTTIERWARDSLGADSPRWPDLQKHVDQARAHARAAYARVPQDGGHAELLDLALLALETEGVQLRHGTLRGLQGGLVIGVTTPAAEVGATVGPVGRYTRGRQGTVQIGTTTIGSDIFIGTEERRAKMLGVAATAGIDMKEIDRSVLSVGFAGLFRHAWGSSDGRGVSLRVSKNVKEHKQVMGRAIAFLFEQAQARRTAGIDQCELWERYACRFINQPELGLEVVGTRDRVQRTGGGIAAGGRMGFSALTGGLFVSGGAEGAWKRSRRIEAGGTPSQTASAGKEVTMSGMVSLAGTAVGQVSISGVDSLRELRFPALGRASARVDLNLGGESVQVRLTVEDGRVQPKLSLAHRRFRHAGEFARYVQAKRGDWEASAKDGKPAVDQFLQELSMPPADHAAANRVYQERRRLTAEAARELSVLLAQRQMLEHAGADAGAAQDALAQVLGNARSWVPEKLAVSEAVSHVSETGIELVGAVHSRVSATSTNRYLLQLKADG